MVKVRALDLKMIATSALLAFSLILGLVVSFPKPARAGAGDVLTCAPEIGALVITGGLGWMGRCNPIKAGKEIVGTGIEAGEEILGWVGIGNGGEFNEEAERKRREHQAAMLNENIKLWYAAYRQNPQQYNESCKKDPVNTGWNMGLCNAIPADTDFSVATGPAPSEAVCLQQIKNLMLYRSMSRMPGGMGITTGMSPLVDPRCVYPSNKTPPKPTEITDFLNGGRNPNPQEGCVNCVVLVPPMDNVQVPVFTDDNMPPPTTPTGTKTAMSGGRSGGGSGGGSGGSVGAGDNRSNISFNFTATGGNNGPEKLDCSVQGRRAKGIFSSSNEKTAITRGVVAKNLTADAKCEKLQKNG